MSRIRRYLPRPALVLGVVALLAATAGTSYAIGQFGVGKLRDGARAKVVGVGKLTYVTTTTNVPVTTVADETTTVKATCPTGPIGNLKPIAGGVKLEVDDPDFTVLESHHITNGWTATVYNNTAEPHTAQVTLACARSIAVTGAPPAS
jgi:hypothetical protein